MSTDVKDLERRMNGAVENLKKELNGLRTGRASAGLLEPVMVEAYGSQMPITSVATINVTEARMISVQVWDRSMVSAVEKGIMNSGLGLNPSADGQTVRVPLPDLSEERRRELGKVAKKYGEDSKIAVRNVRRDGIEAGKKAEKDGDMSKDEARDLSDSIQKITDKFVGQIDEAVASKEQEILQV